MPPDSAASHAPPDAVRGLAWTSFWTDVSSKMVRAIEPLFLVDSIGLGRDVVALLEGLGKGVDSLLRWGSGWWSDRLQHRKPLTLMGYVVSTLSRPVLAVAPSALLVAVAKAGDRAGAGIRKAPRNAWIADAAHENHSSAHGAFLYQKALDYAGAASGLLIALVLLACTVTPRSVVWLSIVPAGVGIFVLARLRERAWAPPKTEAPDQSADSPLHQGALFRVSLLGAAIGLGNMSEKLFVIRAADQLGNVTEHARFLFGAAFVFVAFATAAVVGALAQRRAQRVSARTMLTAGLSLHGIVFLGFMGGGLPIAVVCGLFACQGAFEALARPPARALAAACARDQATRGRAVGAYEGVESVADALATPLAGLLWIHGPGWNAAMLLGLVATAAAFVALALVRPPRAGTA